MSDDRLPVQVATAPSVADGDEIGRLHRLFLWLNSGCNSRCKMCDIWREPKGTHISAAAIARWAPEWRSLSVPSVIICGEPLLHPQLWQIVDAICAHGISVELLSNGYLVPRHARNIVDSCVVLRISLDGPADVHNEVRGVTRAFALVARATAAIHRLSPSFPIDARCAVHRLNFRCLGATVDSARDLGFRSISFSGTDLHNEEAFRRHGMLDNAYVSSLAIAGDELDELERELCRLRTDHAEDFACGFISDSPADLDRLLLDYYRALAGEGSFPTVRCNAPWTSAVVEYDGGIRPCFPLPTYGNVTDCGGFAAVINSDDAVGFRRALDVNTNTACQRCVCQTLS
jgi:MoaA/NifB/PqqE/SkfB family radical SAM enzyme